MNNLNNNVIHVMYILQELEYQYIRVEKSNSTVSDRIDASRITK